MYSLTLLVPFLTDKELLSVWKAAAGLLNIGVLHVQEFLLQSSSPCPNRLYVVLNTDRQTLHQASANGLEALTAVGNDGKESSACRGHNWSCGVTLAIHFCLLSMLRILKSIAFTSSWRDN
jgi:hypothetical protein